VCFKELQVQEEAAIPLRVQQLKQEVGRLTSREADFQDKYKRLASEKERLDGLLASSMVSH
jgi:hypothetical protein